MGQVHWESIRNLNEVSVVQYLRGSDPARIEQLHQWSRHFDTMLWAVTTVFMAAVILLLSYLYSHYAFGLTLLGMAMTVVSVMFAASFRHYRRGVHQQLPPEDQKLLQNQRVMYWQWPMYVGLHLFVLSIYLVLILNKECDRTLQNCGCALYGALSVIIVVYFLAEIVTARE